MSIPVRIRHESLLFAYLQHVDGRPYHLITAWVEGRQLLTYASAAIVFHWGVANPSVVPPPFPARLACCPNGGSAERREIHVELPQ